MCVIRKSCLSLGQLIAFQTIVFLESVVTCLTHLTSKISILPEAHDKAGVLMRVTQGLACPAVGAMVHTALPSHAARKRAKTAQGRGEPPRHRPHPIPGLCPARIGTKKRSISIDDVWRCLEIFDWICLHNFP